MDRSLRSVLLFRFRRRLRELRKPFQRRLYLSRVWSIRVQLQVSLVSLEGSRRDDVNDLSILRLGSDGVAQGIAQKFPGQCILRIEQRDLLKRRNGFKQLSFVGEHNGDIFVEDGP